jgi:hypothetical protein
MMRCIPRAPDSKAMSMYGENKIPPATEFHFPVHQCREAIAPLSRDILFIYYKYTYIFLPFICKWVYYKPILFVL